METMKAITKRKSVRAYKEEAVSEEALKNILAAGCAAPVGMRRYDTLHLTVVKDKTIIGKMSGAIAGLMKIESDPFYGASAVILISSTEPAMPGIDYTNAGCIAENMMLAAADAGIGSVIVWGSGMVVEADADLKKSLGIPDGFSALFGMAFGYSAEDEKHEKELAVTISMNQV